MDIALVSSLFDVATNQNPVHFQHFFYSSHLFEKSTVNSVANRLNEFQVNRAHSQKAIKLCVSHEYCLEWKRNVFFCVKRYTIDLRLNAMFFKYCDFHICIRCGVWSMQVKEGRLNVVVIFCIYNGSAEPLLRCWVSI